MQIITIYNIDIYFPIRELWTALSRVPRVLGVVVDVRMQVLIWVMSDAAIVKVEHVRVG